MGQNNTPFVINGYSYADGRFTFNGLEVPGITSFNFKVAQAKINNYGLGTNPDSRSKGKKEPSGSLGMTPDAEQVVINAFSPTDSILDVPAGTAILSLVKADGGKRIFTMNFFEWQAEGVEGSEGDENLSTDNDIVFGTMNKQDF